MNDKWYNISDNNITRSKILTCSSSNTVTPYLLMYHKQQAVQHPISNEDELTIPSNLSTQNVTFIENSKHERVVNKEKEKMSEDVFSNLAKAVHYDLLQTSTENLASTKSRVVKELFQQTDKIIDAAETAKSKRSFLKKGNQV